MTSEVAVLDSSSLIIFWQIERLELLSQLFTEFVVPAAVRCEVAPSVGTLPAWILERPAPKPPLEALALSAGEREAIALALGLSADFVVLDDLAGRRVASSLGLDVTGSAGLRLRAHGRGLMPSIQLDHQSGRRTVEGPRSSCSHAENRVGQDLRHLLACQ